MSLVKETIVLQSGFLAFKNENFVLTPESVEQQKLLTESKYDRHLIRDNSPFAFHKPISDIFSRYSKDSTLLGKFSFREEIYKAVLDAIGSMSFKDWVRIQDQNVYMTAMNKKYLADLFRYITEGTWSVSQDSWYRLLEAKRATADDMRMKVDESVLGDQPMLTKDVIADWMGLEEPAKNLLYFGATVFGQKKFPRL